MGKKVGVMEHIEMAEFDSAAAASPLVQFQESELGDPEPEQQTLPQSPLEHPLVPLLEEEKAEPVHQSPKQPRSSVTTPPTVAVPPPEKGVARPPAAMKVEIIEMELFPPSDRAYDNEAAVVNCDDSSVTTPEPAVPLPPQGRGAAWPKWRRPAPDRGGLVVKDVVCLGSGHLRGQGAGVPWGREQGVTARLTISPSWGAEEMESRLACLFGGRLDGRPGERFPITYLQCVQGTRVVFIPNPPPQPGWTGAQVLKITGHGPLYILGRHDAQQAGWDWEADRTQTVNRQECRVDANDDGSHDDDPEGETRAESPLFTATVEERTRPSSPLRSS